MALSGDLKNAFRQLAAAPGFTLAVVLSLAFGIGANAAIFTLLNSLLWRPLPVAAPEMLVQVGPAGSFPDQPGAVLSGVLKGLSADPTVAGVCGFTTPLMTLEINQTVKPVSAVAVTGDCFKTLGIRPAVGRLLGPAENRSGAPPAVVISYDAWQQEYSGSADVVGKTVRIEGHPATIIGVTDSRFTGLMLGFPARIYITEEQFMAVPRDTQGQHLTLAYLRRKPGIPIEQMKAHLSVLWPRLLQATVPAKYQGARRDEYLKQKLAIRAASTGIDYILRKRFGGPLYALLGLTSLVLLVACVNVANLMLARGLHRRREMALRVALGAGRWLVIRQLVLESLVLVVAGVSVGLALASAGDRLLILLFQARSTGFELPISPDVRVLLFASIVSAVVLVVAALWPAWRNSDVDTATVLKEGGRSVAGKRSGTRRVLIAAQIALTLVLLSGASIFIQLLRDLQAVPLGFETEGLLNAQLLPLPGGYRDHFDQDSYYRKLLEDMEALPGIQSAALSRFAPLFSQSQPELVTSIQRETSTAQAERIVVSDSFFSTMRIPLLAGSGLPHDDRNSAVKNAIISQSLATKLFGPGDAIGQRLSLGSRGQRPEVVVSGIAADALLFGARASGQFAVYVDYWQYPEEQKWPVLLVRTAGDPGNFLDTIRKKVRAEGHEYPLYVRTLPYQRNMSLMQERLLAWLATGFGIVALTLAAIGLQGLLTYYVNSRTAEIGTRMALGAERRNVQWLVLREALLLIASGAVAGLIVTAALLRVVPSILYESHGIVAAPLAMATFSLLMVGLCAAWFPAWRASRLDPIAALRHE